MILRLIVVLILFIVLSCDSSSQKSEQAKIRNDINLLSEIINLEKYTPLKAEWIYYPLGIDNSRVPGPTDYRLEAVLYYSKEAISELKNNFDSTKIKVSESCSVNFQKINSPKFNGQCIIYNSYIFNKGSLLNGYFLISDSTIYLNIYTN